MLNSQSPAPAPPAIVGACWRPRSAAKAVPRPSGIRRQVLAQVLLQLRAGPPPSRLTIHLPGDALHCSLPRGQRQAASRLQAGAALGTDSRLGTPVGSPCCGGAGRGAARLAGGCAHPLPAINGCSAPAAGTGTEHCQVGVLAGLRVWGADFRVSRSLTLGTTRTWSWRISSQP